MNQCQLFRRQFLEQVQLRSHLLPAKKDNAHTWNLRFNSCLLPTMKQHGKHGTEKNIYLFLCWLKETPPPHQPFKKKKKTWNYSMISSKTVHEITIISPGDCHSPYLYGLLCPHLQIVFLFLLSVLILAYYCSETTIRQSPASLFHGWIWNAHSMLFTFYV